MAIVGCSNDPMHANAKFAQDNQFDFPLLSDTDLKVAVAYGAAEDASAPKAKRIAALIDENGKIAKIYRDLKPADFPATVLADVKKDEL